jgi:uncharacterized membrane-anchored protein
MRNPGRKSKRKRKKVGILGAGTRVAVGYLTGRGSSARTAGTMLQLPRLLIALALLATGLVRAADEKKAAEKSATADAAEKPKSFKQELEENGVKLQSGPATVPLGKTAEMKLPEGYHFVGKDSLDRFYQLTQNMRGGKEVGVVIAPNYMLFFDYDDVG